MLKLHALLIGLVAISNVSYANVPNLNTRMDMTTLSIQELKQYESLAITAAEIGGRILLQYWGNLKHIEDKELVGDLVTEADKESEKCIIEFLKQECPTHSILAEETGEHLVENSDFLWVIDPLDGTVNYAHQYPKVAVSIALLFKKVPVVGVIYNPIEKELFQGTLGCGATLNKQPIHVSQIKELSRSLLTSGFPYDRRETKDNNYAEFCHLTDLTVGVRRGGSAALDLAYVACGRCDGYWERGIKPWDICAGVLIVEEAGGSVSAYDNTPTDLFSGRILATNHLIHQQLSDELIKIKNRLDK